MFFVNLKIKITFIHNSLNRRNRNIVSLSNGSKRNIFLKFMCNGIFKIIRDIRIIFNNISRRGKSLFAIFTNVPLYTKIKLNIVILKGNKFDIMFPRTIFNNVFRITMRTRTIIIFKKTFENLNQIITFLNNMKIVFFWERNIIILNIQNSFDKIRQETMKSLPLWLFITI